MPNAYGHIFFSCFVRWCIIKNLTVFVPDPWERSSESLELPSRTDFGIHEPLGITLELMLRDEMTQGGGWSPEKPSV